jgi:hypothetical protein
MWTVERIASLAATTDTEPLTMEFKEKMTPRIIDCVSYMANTQGGLILIGITDDVGKLSSVKTETLAHAAGMLSTRLDPADYLPEMFKVPLGDDQPGRHILVNPDPAGACAAASPGPTDRAGGDGTFWVPVRIPDGTRQAT